MQRNQLIRLIFCLAVISSFISKGQLSGTVTVPGTYPSLSAALVDINAQGVGGPLTVLISASYTETVPVGGFSLTATGSSANPILFQKSGAGSNPLLVAYVGGTGTPASAVQDGIWRFIGSDYVTIDGIDLLDPNTSNPATMEYGFGFFKANTTNGCQNNLIQNCTINLSNQNNVTGSAPSVDGSRGINVVNTIATFQNGNISPTGAGGVNSNNRFYRNVITNCNVGIALIGYVAPSPFTLADSGNEVGGILATNGNTITNFGGAVGATNAAAGVRTLAQYNFLVANNVFNNNTGTGANHINTLRAIFVNAAQSAVTTIINNTITLNSAAATFTVAGIENSSGAVAASNTITIQGNVLSNCTHTTNTTGLFYGIFNNAASAAGFILSDNKFNNITTSGSTGNTFLLFNTGAIAGPATYTNNQFTGLTHSVTGAGGYFGIWNNAAISSDLVISDNTFSNCIVNHSTGAVNPIYNTGASLSQIQMTANVVTNFSATSNSSGTLALIYNNAASTGSLTLSSNSLTSVTLNNTSGAYHLLYNRGATTNTFNVLNMNTNLFSNITYSSTGAGAFYTLWNNGVTTTLCSVSNNTVISNTWLSTTATRYVIANWGVNTTASVVANLITSSTGTTGTSGPIFFIYNNNPNSISSGTLSILNNTLTNLSFSTSTADQSYIQNAGVSTNTFASILMSGNILSTISSSIGGSGGHYGLYNNTASALEVSILNNTVTALAFNGTNGPLVHFYNRGQANSFFPSVTMSLNVIQTNTYAATSNANLQLMLNAGVASSNFSLVRIATNTITNCVQTSSAAALTGILNTALITGSISIFNNLFTQHTATANLTGVITGIQNSGQVTSSLSINNNSLTLLTTNASTGNRIHIYNTGIGTGTLSIINNLISANTHSASSSASLFHLINGSGTGAALVISNNTISASSSTLQNGTTYLIYNSSATTNTIADIKIESNSLNTYSASSTTGSFFGVQNSLITSSLVSISTNTFVNCVLSGTANTKFLLVNSAIVTGSLSMNSNSISAINLSSNLNGNIFGLYNSSTGSNVAIQSNTIVNVPLATNNTSVFVINNIGTVAGVLKISSNQISQINYSATAGYFSAIQNGAVTGGTVDINSNSFQTNTLTTLTGVVNVICNRGAATSTLNLVTIAANRIDGISHSSTTGTVSAFFSTGINIGTLSIANNTVTNFAITGTASPRALIFNTSTTSVLSSISANVLGQQSYSLGQNLVNAMILNTGPSTGSISITSNSISGLAMSATTTAVSLIQNSGAAGDNLSISSNVISQSAFTHTGTSSFNVILNSSPSGSVISISGNAISTLSASVPAGSLCLIYSTRAGALSSSAMSIQNNTVSANSLRTNTGYIVSIYSSSLTAQESSFTANLFSNNIFASTTGSVFQILNNSPTSQSLTISSNVFSTNTNSSSATALHQGIVSWQGTDVLSLSSNTFISNTSSGAQLAQRLLFSSGSVLTGAAINQNVFTLNTQMSQGSGTFKYIENFSQVTGNLSINSNSLVSNQNAVFSGNLFLIRNGGSCSGLLQISGNQLSQGFSTSSNGFSGDLKGILNDSFVQTGTLAVTQNTFENIVFASGASGDIDFIQNLDNPNEVSISNNVWSNLVLDHSGQEQFIYNEASQSSLTVVGNSIATSYIRTGAAGNTYLYVAGTNTPQSTNEYIANNNFTSISATVAGSGSFFGINSQNAAASKTITANLIGNISYNASGFMYLLKVDGLGNASSPSPSQVSSNTLSTILWQGPFYGCDIASNASSSIAVQVFDNSVSSVTAVAGSPGMYGLNLNGTGQGINAYRNTVGDLKESSGIGAVTGILLNSSTTSQLSNNVVGDLAAPNSLLAESANGIKLAGTGLVEAYYNSVVLFGAYSGTNTGSNALNSSLTGTLDLQNNILVNRLTANGSGIAAALRRNTASLNSFANASDRNLLYAGIPSSSNVLYTNGSTSYSILPAYINHVSPREANSVSEDVSFLSTNIISPLFLRVDPTINTAAESGALNITGITTDVDAQVRQGNPGYAGTGTNPDIGADEFNQNLAPCTTANSGIITSSSGTVLCEGTSAYLYSSGYSTNGNINFQWKYALAAGGPYTNVTTGFGFNKTALNTATLSAGNYYFILETQCANGPVSATSNEYTLQVNALPGASATINPLQVCAGNTVSLAGSSANGASFVWSGPGSFTSSLQNPQLLNVSASASGVYTVTSLLAGCSSSAIANLTVAIQPLLSLLARFKFYLRGNYAKFSSKYSNHESFFHKRNSAISTKWRSWFSCTIHSLLWRPKNAVLGFSIRTKCHRLYNW